MYDFVHRWGEEALSCRCNIKCCHFEGCCSLAQHRDMEPGPYVEDYVSFVFLLPVKDVTHEFQKPTTIQNTGPRKAHARLGFFDLPAEIRNKIYVLTVLKPYVIRMRLNPTIMDHGEEHTWGRHNAWAMLAVCRRIYHEASPLAYKENIFEVRRGGHRDFTMVKHPGMPWDHIQFVHLHYPPEASPCSWRMDHMWTHWLEDVATLRNHFPNLHRLNLKMGYEGFEPNSLDNYYTWAPLLFKGPGESDEAMLKRVTGVLRAMTQLHGHKMPHIVQIYFCGYFQDPTGAIHPADHHPLMINDAILKVADPNIDIDEYSKESLPLHWPEDLLTVGYEGQDNPMGLDMDLEGELSDDDGD